ncbi:MAG: aminodeoxychorismate lyase [Verrucomicrobiota bacterium]
MQVFLNGQFVPEEQAVVSVFDRSFLYGDGLFETMLVHNAKPFRWAQHLDRLERGAAFLKIKLPFSAEALRGFVEDLIVRNQMPNALLRLTLSRGVGPRGYSPKGAEHSTLVMSLHSAPGGLDSEAAPRWKLLTSSLRLPAGERVAQFKTCNKLAQILARAEADAAEADEALLLNTDGFVVEASSSNLFWLDGNVICTPPLAGGILAGVTRAVVLEVCQSLGLVTEERHIALAELKQVQGIFLSLSSWGVVEAQSLDGSVFESSQLAAKIRSEYLRRVRLETI